MRQELRNIPNELREIIN
jgi:hypothetical protein